MYFSYHNKKQWEDACSYNSLTITLTTTKLSTTIKPTIQQLVGKQYPYTTIKNNGKMCLYTLLTKTMTLTKPCTAIEYQKLTTINDLLVNNTLLYYKKEPWKDACFYKILRVTKRHALLSLLSTKREGPSKVKIHWIRMWHIGLA